MSGPTSAIVIVNQVAVMVSAAAIRAAAAVEEGYAQQAALQQHHTANRATLNSQQAQALETRLAALQQQAQAAETELEQLIKLAERLDSNEQIKASRLSRPADSDAAALAAYVRGMQVLTGELKSILLTEAARQVDNTEPLLEFNVADNASPPSTTQRLLARIAHLGPAPAEIASLALEIDGTTSAERIELLTSELRKRIQTYLETTQQQQVQEATALVLEQSLKDLGYQVEAVANTLFVEGGVIHFRRQGWGDYMVRLRVDAQTATVNFNVIRAVTENQNERSVLDHLAEDRWCAEFPALMQALEARGVRLEVTRRLEAGELPVQLVQRDKLPRFADNEETAAGATKAFAQQLR